MKAFIQFLGDNLLSSDLPTRIGSWLILFFLCTTFIFVFTTVYSRMKKSWLERKYGPVRQKIEELLTDFVFDEQRYIRHEEEYNKLLANLKKLSRHSNPKAKLVDTILSLNNSLKGETGDRLQELYVDLNIKKEAEYTLKHGEWYEKAYIIKELAQMNIKESLPLLMKYINHYKRILREEAQFAAVTLGGLSNLDFLMSIKTPLSEWQQTRILLELDRNFHNQLPSFYYLLKAKNHSVVIFGLKLISHFRQMGDIAYLEEAFLKGDDLIKENVIMCLVQLEDPEGRDFLRKVYPNCSAHARLKIIEALGYLGSEEDFVFLTQILKGDDYSFLMAASRALLKLGFQPRIKELQLPERNTSILIHAQHENLV